jgi:FHS family glucose/mannose:H+ symporter-like MFS transporter
LTGLALASFLAFGTLLVLFGANATEIISDLGLDYAQFGLLGSMLSLGLGIGIVAAGPISDRFPRRPLFISSCVLVISAATTLGPDTTYQRLIIHMIAIGLGAGFYETVLNVIVVENFPDTAGRRLLFIHSGAPFAACVVPLLIDIVRDPGALEWYETFRIAGLLHLPLVVAACFVTMGFASSTGTPDPNLSEISTPVKAADRLSLIILCIAIFAYVGVESALTIFVVDHAATDLGLPAARAARTISSFWGGLLVGRLAAGLSPRSPAAGTTALLAAAAAAMLLAFELAGFGSPEFAMAAVGLVLGGVFPVMIGLAGTTLPSSPATALGLAGGLGSAGGFVVPWITGRMAADVGLPFAFVSLAGWLLLLAVAAAAVRFRRRN